MVEESTAATRAMSTQIEGLAKQISDFRVSEAAGIASFAQAA
jgi:hypothetical protein